ncbi:uncharacterized protein LOC127873694 isoform X4 [Dreissena polymorpha]|nr:uncharacterized protein LOC127873694 isoform X4 [Dreissena polymorpha]
MPCESGSAFGGSSTSGTLTSTDSNVSGRDPQCGTLASTDSNNSGRQHHPALHPHQFDVFGLLQSRALEGSGYPERQPSPSRSSTSGSDHRQITLLERLQKTHPIWFLPKVGRNGAVHLLKDRDIGVFIVRASSQDKVMALSVQFPDPKGSPNIDHYLIQLVEAGYHLQGSARLFPSIPELIAYYCDHKEDLPHKLALPPAVLKARTIKELDSLAMLGQDFWTSAKYDSQSRSSSRSNLSEISSGMNKSQSEPISIKKSTVMAYSQSDAILRDNTPPKHSVIDFSSYLIQKPDRDINFTSVTSACQHSVTQQQDSVHTRCSESGFMRTFHQSKSESKLSSHVSSKTHHLVSTQHVTSKSHVTDKMSSFSSVSEDTNVGGSHEFVLHVNDKENRVDIRLSKRDSQVSVPYAKPNKFHHDTLVLSPQGFLQPTNSTEEYYWRSNLSDKMSDYEDIWKNNYADPKMGSVHSDIRQHLQPQLLSPKCVSKAQAFDLHDTEVFTENWHSDKCVIKDLNVSLDKLDMSKDATKQEETVITSKTVTTTQSANSSVVTKKVCTVRPDVNRLEPLASSSKQSNDKNITDTEKCSEVQTVQDKESDLESDNSNGCHSEADDADTEDCDDRPMITSVQTQTSPVCKLKSPSFGKSISTNSLSTMRSPIYTEPFDAISQDDKDKKGPKQMAKKIRRQSAPAVGVGQRRRPSTDCHKLTPVSGETIDTDEIKVSENNEHDSESTDDEDVFEISLELVQPSKHKSIENFETNPYGLAWVDSKLSPKEQAKPMPIPRKTKVSKNLLHTAVSNHRSMNEVTMKIDLWRQETLKNSTTNPDPLHFLAAFDENHNQANATLNKFPVYSKTVSDEHKVMYSEGSTAEDMITSRNPELTLRPMQPFQIYGPHSEYDNLNSNTNSPYVCSSMQSNGTLFHTPWEHGIAAKIMHISKQIDSPHNPVTSPPPCQAPPPLPAIDPHDRIRAWQVSSQKYAPCVPGNDDCESVEKRLSLASDLSAENLAIGIDHAQKSQSDKTIVNEKSTSHSETVTEKNSDSIPLFATDLHEKIVPALANPRLLHQLSRNRHPDRTVREYIIGLSKNRDTTFGSTIYNFIQCTLESHDTNPHNITRNVRQFMTGIKNYLVKHGEGELEDLIERERNQLGKDEILNIDAIIEGALHVCVIQPLKQHIYNLFVNEYTRNGSIRLLLANIKYARTKTSEEIGIQKGVAPPDGSTLDQVKHYFTKMQKSYSPLKKLEHLLSATSTIYKYVAQQPHSSCSPPVFGADDFLPVLIYVLIQCGIVSVEIEADYMWGLLHPSLLNGEGGYYLTSLSSAVLVLKNFKEMQESNAAQTQLGKLPSISDMQGFLKIAIPDEQRDTIMWRTLPVRPSMTTRDVCSLIAHKFKFTNPQDYGLYTLDNGEEHKLMDMECPQSLKAKRLAHNKECIFAYKRNAANIAWPKSVQ